MKQLGLLDVLGLAGFEGDPGDRIVRHQHGRYPVAELLAGGLLETYQAYQSRPVFHRATHVITLYGLQTGTKARFFGVFRVEGWKDPKKTKSRTGHPWEAEWRGSTRYFYALTREPGFEHLEERVVVDWGPGALAWCQQFKKANKPIVEVTAPGRKLPQFADYLEFSLSHTDLMDLYREEDAHPEWRSRLSAVAGVYLILAEASGELYIGSATGAEGIWGRWRVYARTGHGNNDMLRRLVDSDKRYPKAFRFSVLQIVPKSMTREDVISREARFKMKLGSRAHGLNLN
jgi:hypothetical protein